MDYGLAPVTMIGCSCFQLALCLLTNVLVLFVRRIAAKRSTLFIMHGREHDIKFVFASVLKSDLTQAFGRSRFGNARDIVGPSCHMFHRTHIRIGSRV